MPLVHADIILYPTRTVFTVALFRSWTCALRLDQKCVPASRIHSPDPDPIPLPQTAQLLEALHAHDTLTSSSLPPGLLIANDSDYKRTHLLIHQAARLPSPALMVTNLDASIFPAIKIPSGQTSFAAGTKARVAAKKQYQLLFDRILCDVPCSGDGTLRKNPGIWKHWSPMDGNGLHR